MPGWASIQSLQIFIENRSYDEEETKGANCKNPSGSSDNCPGSSTNSRVFLVLEETKWTAKGVKIRVSGKEYLIHTKAFMEAMPDEGQEVDLDALLYRSNYFYAMERAESYLSRGPRTARQMKDYLIKRDFFDVVEEVVAFLEEVGLIDDRDYARIYYEQERHRRGSHAIEQRLRDRGIDSSTIYELYMEEDPRDAWQILEKKYGPWGEVDYKEEIKRKNFLLGRGFSYETINKAVELAKFGDLEDKD